MSEEARKSGWKMLVHGGAGVIERRRRTVEADRAIRAAPDHALATGAGILEAGGDALDSVEAAARELEDDPHFNAGRGSVLTYQGTNEMDAAIMAGRSRAAGAVTGVTATRNPVSLARAVMEKSPHVMLSREGADQFSREQDLEQAEPEWFATDERLRQLEEVRSTPGGWSDEEMKYGTVGAVALDERGNLAAATSTGGITGKRWGRIGDTPIVGAGTWADGSCAVSATGTGEYFIRAAVAHEIAARMRLAGESLQQAVDAEIADIIALGGTGGVIAVAADGDTALAFNSAGMYRGLATPKGRTIAIYGDEDC